MEGRIKNINRLSGTLRKAAVTGFSLVALSTFAISAKADLVVNGSFENTSNPGNGGPVNNSGEIGYNITVDNWSVTGGANSHPYGILFAPKSGTTSGTFADNGGTTTSTGTSRQLWGPGDGSVNGLTVSPDGGNFVALDGDPGSGTGLDPGEIQQTITGLTSGNQYTVTFYWAAAQEQGFNGATTEALHVGFGGSSQNTTTVNNANHGFVNWMLTSMTFTADGPSDVLSFLAAGTPSSCPPFVLLDGVTVNGSSPVPEPGSVVLMLSVLGLMVVFGVRRSKAQLVKS